MQILQVQLILHLSYLAQSARLADIRLETRHHTAEVKVMMGQELRWQSRRIRDPELDLGIGPGEPLRKNAHHCVWLSVEMDLSADNRRLPAEPPLEEIPGKHDGASIRTIFAL